MDVRDFDFDLPADLIAQEPAAQRSAARLLHLERSTGSIAHSTIGKLPELLQPGDLVVVNNTRVFPARLVGRRVPSGGAVECLLISRLGTEEGGSGDGGAWEALVHPGQKLKPGARMVFEGVHTLHAEILERRFFGRRVIRLWTEDGSAVDASIDEIGHGPSPPYIKPGDTGDDRDRYQTVFARRRGSVAAPTAGLHFTGPLLEALGARGVTVAEITLHVGYGTFQPVRVDGVVDPRVDAARYAIDESAAARVNPALAEGRRVTADGTTTTRTLEAVARAQDGRIVAGERATDLFIYPGVEFRI